jgi:MtaA/CmuA family methyltransferase
MNGYQRIMAAFQGGQPDTVPVMLHNFMMAAHEAGLTMKAFRHDPREMARAFIEAIEKYEYDGIMIDVDTVTLAGAAGVPIESPLDQPSVAVGPRLHTLEEVRDLEPVDISQNRGVQVWLEATSILCRYFGNDVLIRGNCDQSPFTLASLIRGLEPWMLDLADENQHELVHRLLEYSTTLTHQFIRLMSETGAHMISNGDSAAGPELISPAMYRTFALPYEQKIVHCAHDLRLPYVLHICGNTSRIIDGMLDTGSDGLELDYRTDALLARDKMKDRAVFVGNIDPSGVLALGTPALVEERTRDLLKIFADVPRFVLNAGCAIPTTTPPENLRAMIHTARGF